jgi:hypothetical protein
MTEELAQHNTAIRAGRLSKRLVTTRLAGLRERAARGGALLLSTAAAESYRHATDSLSPYGQKQRAVVFLSLRTLREAWRGVSPLNAWIGPALNPSQPTTEL